VWIDIYPKKVIFESPHQSLGCFRMITKMRPQPHIYERLLIDSEHQQRLVRIARKQTAGSPIEWEDAVQIAQMKVLQALRSGKFRQGEPADFYRWAATVARFEIIDLVRKAKINPCSSLDANLPGTNLAVLDTIADKFEFDAAETLERADLVLRAIAAITTLDRQYPQRGYQILWNGQVAGTKQAQLAVEIGITQGEVSKRWQELVGRVAEVLGLVSISDIKREQENRRKQKTVRPRSNMGDARRSTEKW
jgi:RNA polymerase sigma factor (sigma-70 family)